MIVIIAVIIANEITEKLNVCHYNICKYNYSKQRVIARVNSDPFLELLLNIQKNTLLR